MDNFIYQERSSEKNFKKTHKASRILRACNQCRQRKIKCDRQHPCRQCYSSFSDCSYPDQEDRKIKKRIRGRIEGFEERLRAVESCFQLISTPQESDQTTIPGQSDAKTSDASHSSCKFPAPYNSANFAMTEHAVEQSETGYCGSSAERAFILRMRQKLTSDLKGDIDRGLQPSYDHPVVFTEVENHQMNRPSLPSQATAVRLINSALTSYALFNVVHRPTVERMLDRLYEIKCWQYGKEELRFLPLCFAILAVGCISTKDSTNSQDRDSAITKGLYYFRASRRLVDVAEDVDLCTLQAHVFWNIFTLNTTKVATSYTFLGFSLTLAVRSGLHRKSISNEDYIIQETRKRVFWTLKLFSNHVSIIGGLPPLLSDQDIDQELPLEIDDRYISRDRIQQQPEYEPCLNAASGSYKRLHMTLDKIVRKVYPRKGIDQNSTHDRLYFNVDVDTVKSLEDDLLAWQTSLPKGYRLGRDSADTNCLTEQYMLAMSYSYTQSHLYRPFLHYLARSIKEPSGGLRKFPASFAAACIQAGHNTICIAQDMCGRGLLTRANWFVTHKVFHALLSQLYVLADLIMEDSCDVREIDIICEDLSIGDKLLKYLSHRLLAAERAETVLKLLTESVAEESEVIHVKLSHAQSQNLWLASENSVSETFSAYEQNLYTAALAVSIFGLDSASFRKQDTSTWLESIPRPPQLKYQVPQHEFEPVAPCPNSRMSSAQSATSAQYDFISNEMIQAQEAALHSQQNGLQFQMHDSINVPTSASSGPASGPLSGWHHTTVEPAYHESQQLNPFFVSDGIGNIDYSNNAVIRNYLDMAFSTEFSSNDWAADYFNI